MSAENPAPRPPPRWSPRPEDQDVGRKAEELLVEEISIDGMCGVY